MPDTSKRESSEMSLNRLIDDIEVNDEKWYCLVTMLVETRESQMRYTLLLNEVCENGCRKAVHLINREKMLAKLRLPVKGRSPYTVKERPSVQKIRESIQTSLQDQSSDTIKKTGLSEAALIKWMIYEVRLEWLARSVSEREEPQPKTKLRRRGEEWKDRVYVEDAPENGPDLYVLLTGFCDSKLPVQLIEIRVPLNCILRLDDFHFDEEHRVPSPSNFETVHFMRSDYQLSVEDKPMNFWSEFDKNQCPNLAIRNFCPPSNLRDLYDRISYVLYDMDELMQAHAAYLCAMKVIHVYDSRPEKQIASAYEIHLSTIPEERITVDIIVEAMLCEVEKSFQLEDDYFFRNTEQTHHEEKEAEKSSRQTSLSRVNSAAFERLTEKLRLLNLKYELIPGQPELILCDDDCLNVCRANDQACNLKDLPRISRAWYQRDRDEEEACEIHLLHVLECAQIEGTERYRANHLLNVLGLRKIFNLNSFNHELSKQSDCNSVKDKYHVIESDDNFDNGYVNEKNSTSRGYQSEVGDNNNALDLTRNIFKKPSFETNTFYNDFFRARSDIRRNDELASLLSLLSYDSPSVELKSNFTISSESITSKEDKIISTISSDSVLGCRCNKLVVKSTMISEARRLSSLKTTTLLQSFEKCTSLFGLIDARESLGLKTSSSPTDSSGYPPLEFAELLDSPCILLDCFHRYMFSDVQYFAPTDSFLLLFYDERPGRVAQRRVTCSLRTPICLRDFCEYVVDEEGDWIRRRTANTVFEKPVQNMMDENAENVVFKDEDFLLPGSLKASRLLKLKDEDMCNVADEKKPVVNAATPLTVATSSNTSRSLKNNGSKVKPNFEFVGYDLGVGRVQVTNLMSSYEAGDGTRLRLTRDTWLHDDAKETTTSVEIEIPDRCSLRYHEMSQDDKASLFHLTTKNGLIVAFAKKSCFSDNMNRRNKLTYDIQLSWPNGLIAKPVEFSDANYPFYILQYYSTKHFRCESIKNETHRKYLYNGDIIKFFNDDTIVVLRPNGIVITIERTEEGGNSEPLSCWEKNYINGNIGLSRETWIILQKYFSECKEMRELRYVVLELDGRCYEVVDGQIIRELDRLRAYLAEEYSAEEKFARRADGTDALFTSNAELIVSFPDGTRTLSRCVVEDIECEDGFVMVSMYNHAEHPKYASVAGHRVMMHQLEFQLDEFRLECGNDIRVEAESQSVSISRLECECSSTSRVSFDLATREKRLVRLHDKASRLLLTVWRRDAHFEVTPEICEHENIRDEKPRNCRIFAMNRDGATYEYFHRSQWKRYFLQDMLEDDRASLVTFVLDDMDRFLGLLPRHEWTMEYKIQKAKPSVVDEEDKEEEENEFASKATTRQRFLRARLLEGIGYNTDGEDPLINIQKALLRYWREIATGDKDKLGSKTVIPCVCGSAIERWLRDVVRGRVDKIDFQSYAAGHQKLQKMRAEQDEERTRQLIDHFYARDSVPETDVLDSDNK